MTKLLFSLYSSISALGPSEGELVGHSITISFSALQHSVKSYRYWGLELTFLRKFSHTLIPLKMKEDQIHFKETFLTTKFRSPPPPPYQNRPLLWFSMDKLGQRMCSLDTEDIYNVFPLCTLTSLLCT